MSQIVEPIADTPAPNPARTRPPDGSDGSGRIRWTRRQFHAMLEHEILTGRYELVEGEIIPKMGQGPKHAYVITRLTAWLFLLFGADFVRFQLPIRVPDQDSETSEPEPDAAVLDRPAVDFLDETPGAAHVLIVIEVADATLRFDRDTKALLYARAGLPEYWVVDIAGRQILVHRLPSPTGYAEITVYAADETVATLARPDAPVSVADLLPPA